MRHNYKFIVMIKLCHFITFLMGFLKKSIRLKLLISIWLKIWIISVHEIEKFEKINSYILNQTIKFFNGKIVVIFYDILIVNE